MAQAQLQGAAPQDPEGEEMGEEGTKGWGCTRGGLGEGEKRGRERAAAEEPRPKSEGKTPSVEGGSPGAFDSMG